MLLEVELAPLTLTTCAAGITVPESVTNLVGTSGGMITSERERIPAWLTINLYVEQYIA